MLRVKRNNVLRALANRKNHRAWTVKRKIERIIPKNTKAKVLILNLGPDPRRSPGKVAPEMFFRPFCRILAQCGIATTYACDIDEIEREIIDSDRMPIILINLIHELYDDLNLYSFSEFVVKKVRAVFNSRQTATIVRDKQETNDFLSKFGVLMPSLNPGPDRMVFSNTRSGTHDPVFISDSLAGLDKSRYNTEFVDTTVNFRDKAYYTSIRLNCVGSNIVQINVRASEKANGNPAVHAMDYAIRSNAVRIFP